jgi:hypothetical protein
MRPERGGFEGVVGRGATDCRPPGSYMRAEGWHDLPANVKRDKLKLIE